MAGKANKAKAVCEAITHTELYEALVTITETQKSILLLLHEIAVYIGSIKEHEC